jgi:serine O-acetyltransferase
MIFKHFREDIEVVLTRDPAARSRLEVILCYPGLHALLFHRLAHRAWQGGWRVLGRFLSHLGRLLTGIEIHPGARIGRRVFIDHGMGVVIGETSELGNDVTLYQGVTLGGTSLEKGKRHPTLEDGVIVGAGAKILGPLTVGAGARVGSNAVVLKPVAAGATVVGIPAREVVQQRAKPAEFCAYGSSGDLPDPVARALDSVSADMVALRRRVAELEEQVAVAQAVVERPALVAGDRARLVAVKGDER